MKLKINVPEEIKKLENLLSCADEARNSKNWKEFNSFMREIAIIKGPIELGKRMISDKSFKIVDCVV